MSKDIRDILNVDRGSGVQVSKDKILGVRNIKKLSLPPADQHKPRGMMREIFTLTNNNKTDLPPVVGTDFGKY